MKTHKTNAARLLDSAGIGYELLPYRVDEEDLSAVHVAQELGEDIRQVFKTLVLRGERTGLFVCVVPGESEVDLKKAARAAGDKKADLIPMKEQEEIADYRKFHAQNPDLYPDTAWLDMILKKNALRQSHALSITSAGKTTRTKISLAYDDVDGLFRKNLSWKRFTVRANNDIRLA